MISHAMWVYFATADFEEVGIYKKITFHTFICYRI